MWNPCHIQFDLFPRCSFFVCFFSLICGIAEMYQVFRPQVCKYKYFKLVLEYKYKYQVLHVCGIVCHATLYTSSSLAVFQKRLIAYHISRSFPVATVLQWFSSAVPL